MSTLASDAWIVRRIMEGRDATPADLARVSASIREAVATLAATPLEVRGGAFGDFETALSDHVSFVDAMATVDPDGPPPNGGATPMGRPALDPSPSDSEWLDGLAAVLARHESEAAAERFGTPIPEPEAAPPTMFDKLDARPEPAPTADDDDLDWLDAPPKPKAAPEAPSGPPMSADPCGVAAWLIGRGFRPVPVRGENPGCVGGAWDARAYTPRTFQDVYTSPYDDGVGIRLGPDAGPDGAWLADLECDGPEGAESLRKLFGGPPPDTMGWGSTRGPHRLYAVDQAFANALAALAGKPDGKGVYHLDDFPDLEFRAGGFKPDGSPKAIQSVCPPPRGTDGEPRRWIGPPTVATIPPDVAERLERAAAKRPAERPSANPEPVSRPSTAFGATAGDSRPAYGRAALDAECQSVAATAEGGPSTRRALRGRHAPRAPAPLGVRHCGAHPVPGRLPIRRRAGRAGDRRGPSRLHSADGPRRLDGLPKPVGRADRPPGGHEDPRACRGHEAAQTLGGRSQG